jgi:predicted metal-dependent TIM-barrel fold hydrolase
MSIFLIFGEILPLANQEIQVPLILHTPKNNNKIK